MMAKRFQHYLQIDLYYVLNEQHQMCIHEMMDGHGDPGTTDNERRFASTHAPVCNPENCLNCNMCSFVCPHGVIRPYLLDREEFMEAPEYIQQRCTDVNFNGKVYHYIVSASIGECTGCGLCEKVCPGKAGNKAISLVPMDELQKSNYVRENDYLRKHVTDKEVMNRFTIKGSQFIKPKFRFPGACAGCGETPYLKLISQLYGENMIVANATGCSSIYSASFPSQAYSTPWANSLFEDNAEFGMGMYTADQTIKEKIKNILTKKSEHASTEARKIFENYIKHVTKESSEELYEFIKDNKDSYKELYDLKHYIKKKDFFIVGGDGWAYDIGFSGIDHVLASGSNVNIIVLDTEVYSNTGGQSSKSTQIGGIAKFAADGKKVNKKDLTKIALTYEKAYVATISLGANMNQAIKAINEAVEYEGPSLIICYAPCISHGIIKGMSNSIDEEKLATQSGYFPLFRRHPENGFTMDSKADFTKYMDFINGEDRYRSLEKLNPDMYKELQKEQKANAENRFNYFNSLQTEKKEEK